jgi:hypothetical protein
MRTILLASGAAVALSAASGPAMADDLQTLRDQLSKLQSKVAKIEADRAVKARKVAAAAAVEAGDRPKTWKLPGTNTSMRIGGYVKLDIIWDFDGRGFHFHFPAAQPGNPGRTNGSDFRFLARQSRLFVVTTTPTDWGTLMTRIEGDFYGNATGGNQGFFRLRHALGCLGPVCAGHTWSAWMPVWAGLPTLDFGGAQSAIFVRHGILKYTHNFGGGWVAHIGLEDPMGGRGFGNISSGGGDATIAVGPGSSLANDAQQFPDVVGGLFYNWKGGRAWVGGILRQEEVNGGTALTTDTAIGWGIAAAAAMSVHKRVKVGFQGFWGQGIQSYIPGLTSGALVPGFATSAVNGVIVNGSLNMVETWGIFAWAQVALTDTIRVGAVWAYAETSPEDENPTGKIGFGTPLALTKYVQSLHANLIWSPVPAVNIGIEYSWFQHGRINNADATLHRIHIAFQYLF